MPFIIDTTVRAAQGAILQSNDEVIITTTGRYIGPPGGSLFITSAVGTTTGISFSIDGEIEAEGSAIALGVAPQAAVTDTEIAISGTGRVSGQTAIYLAGGDNRIVNAGTVMGTETAILIEGRGAAPTSITNTGLLVGSTSAIEARGDSALTITNSGTILAAPGQAAILLGSDTATNDVLRNSGLIIGDVFLGAGNDSYRLVGGGRVEGRVNGGAGDDTFAPGAAAETLAGNSGRDTLDFGSAKQVTVALDRSLAGTGFAAGDRYTGFDNIIGSRRGDDVLVGSKGANTLSGLGGSDSLTGGAGSDRLIGGAGTDLLAGGAGNDTFVFSGPADFGDAIVDFSPAAAGDDDRIEVSDRRLGGTLAPGVLSEAAFVVAETELAQDADDRFIFRTSDQTLWFDSDGVGGLGPLLVADFQAGVMLTAADILVVA